MSTSRKKDYRTLTGETIDISAITGEDRTFLGQLVKAYQAGESYPDFVNRMNAPGSPALAGGAWVTGAVIRSPLYRVCQDLADRLGIAQGFLAPGPSSEVAEAGAGSRQEQELLSCEEAAELIRVSAEAIRKAIRQKRLAARQLGRTYALDRRAVLAYAGRAGRLGAPAGEVHAIAAARPAPASRVRPGRRRAAASR